MADVVEDLVLKVTALEAGVCGGSQNAVRNCCVLFWNAWVQVFVLVPLQFSADTRWEAAAVEALKPLPSTWPSPSYRVHMSHQQANARLLFESHAVFLPHTNATYLLFLKNKTISPVIQVVDYVA